VLRKKYPAAVPELPGAPPSAGAAAAPGAGRIIPLRPVEPGPVAPPAPTNPTSIYPTYEVSEKGETLREIARRTLGSGEYWRRVWDLNRTFNPAARIPGGTILRLPPEARVSR